MCTVVFSNESEGQRDAALKLLQHFSKDQDWTRHFCMKTVTDLQATSLANKPEHQVGTFFICRNGELLSISGAYDFLGSGKPYHFQTILGPEIGTRYQAELSKPPTRGSIIKQPRADFEKQYCSFHYGAGLDGYFSSTQGMRINETMAEAADLRVEGKEQINGSTCDIVAATTKFGSFRVWFDTSHSHAIRKLTFSRGGNDLFEKGKPLSEAPQLEMYDGQRLVRWLAIVDDVRLEAFDGVSLPVSGRMTVTKELSDNRSIRNVIIYNRSDINLRPEFVALNAFAVDIPDGTPVSYIDDPDAGLGFIWKDGRVVTAGEAFTGTASGSWNSSSWLRPSFVVLNLVVLALLGWFWLQRKRRWT